MEETFCHSRMLKREEFLSGGGTGGSWMRLVRAGFVREICTFLKAREWSHCGVVFFFLKALLQWTEPSLFLPELFTDNYSLNKPQWLLCQPIWCAARKHQFVAIALGELSRVQWRLGLSPKIETWQWDIKCSQIKSSRTEKNKRIKQAGLLLKRVGLFSR